MCGISGFNFKDEKLIRAMVQSLEHRGPDDQGFYLDDGVSLGHNRLSIIDLSPKGHQPMFTADSRYAITYNGELYNFQEIKKDLAAKGYKFISQSDTEVILYAYAAYGPACLDKFNGIFALAIWDKEKQELFAARDHFGIKPFFYYFKDNKFIFASEIKAILEHPVSRELDLDSLNLFFRLLYIPGPRTIFKNIKKLSAGHYLLLRAGRLTISRYYNLAEKIKQSPINSWTEAKQLVRQTFDQAVQRQLISDRPLGLFLSGGLDSTAILGSMARLVPGQIKTFSVKFDIDREEEKFNIDSRYARQSSEYYHTDHHELLVTAKDVRDNLEKVVYHQDDLVSNHTMTATYLLAKLAKPEITVALGGDGGDEIFAGYERYYYYHLIEKLQKIPQWLRKNWLSRQVLSGLGRSQVYEKLNAADAFDLWSQFRKQPEDKIRSFLQPAVNNFASFEKNIKELYFTQPAKNYAAYLMQVDLESWLVDESLIKSDKLTMASGLEQRIPILDKELVELAYSLPMSYKIKSARQGKYIFKEAVKNYLPDFIYNKPKTGWFSPAAKWLRTDLRDMAYEILSPDYNPASKAYFDWSAIRKILDDHMTKRAYGLNSIWPLMVFQIWYRLFKNNSSR